MSVSSESMDKVHARIMSHKQEIISNVKKAISSQASSGNEDYKTIWNQLQYLTAPIVQKILQSEFKDAKFDVIESKSTYPDLKMSYQDLKIAIDIKSNESFKEPWYDIARIDSITKERINKYDEEYEILIKYDSGTLKILEVYFELLRDTVGINLKSGGVKFRPYDGKLRPKNWDDFDRGKTYWRTKDDFIEGIKKSQIFRWKYLVENTLIPILSVEEKKQFKLLFS